MKFLGLHKKRPKGTGNLFWGDEEHAIKLASTKSSKRMNASRIETFEQAPTIKRAIEKKEVNSYIKKQYGDVTPETIGNIRTKVRKEIHELR